MPWSTSRRRGELPANWSKLRAAAKRRAHGRCEALIHEPGCDGIGTDCDHIGNPLDHSLSNLQWLSAICHRAKTRQQARAALLAQQAKARHPVETHPRLEPK